MSTAFVFRPFITAVRTDKSHTAGGPYVDPGELRMPRAARRSLYRTSTLAITALLLTFTALPAGTGNAAPDVGLVASGPDWTVAAAAGGYVVSLSLDAPLPVRNDAPVLV